MLLESRERGVEINYYVLRRSLLRHTVEIDTLLNVVNVGALSRTKNGFKQNDIQILMKHRSLGKLGSIRYSRKHIRYISF